MAFRRIVIELTAPLCKCKNPFWRKKLLWVWQIEVNKEDSRRSDLVVRCTSCKEFLRVPHEKLLAAIFVYRDLPNEDKLPTGDVMPEIEVEDKFEM